MSGITDQQAITLLCSEQGLKVYAERSSNAQGRKILLGSVWSVAIAGGMAAVNNRVWPVAVFLAAVSGALTLAFSVNVKDARAFERLRFQGNNFEITRVDRYGRESKPEILPAYHTNFIEEGDPEKHNLFARTYREGKHEMTPIASFLSLPEKEALLKLLNEAKQYHARADFTRDLE